MSRGINFTFKSLFGFRILCLFFDEFVFYQSCQSINHVTSIHHRLWPDWGNGPQNGKALIEWLSKTRNYSFKIQHTEKISF